MTTENAAGAKQYFAQKLAYTTGPFELDAMIKRGDVVTVVDVRFPNDYALGHIPGAVNLPPGKWQTLTNVPKDRTAILYCYNQTCRLAATAAVELASRGIAVVEMEGGFDTWEKYGLKIEK